MNRQKSMKCLCVDSLDELSDYRDDWEVLRTESGGSIFNSYLFTRLRLESFPSASPRILIVDSSRDVCGIGSFALLRDRMIGLQINTLAFAGNAVGAPHWSSLGPFFDQSTQGVVDCLVAGIGKLDCNRLRMNHMESDMIARHFIDAFCSSFEVQAYTSDTGTSCTFPEKGEVADGFGRRWRKHILQTTRLLEKEGRLEVRNTSTSQEVETAMRTYIQQHVRHWRARGGSIFGVPANADFLVKMAVLVQEHRLGTVYEVLIDDEVAGQIFVLFDGDIPRDYRVGMNDSFAKYSPGKLATYFAMVDAHRRGFKTFDLGRGEEEYKFHFGAKSRPYLGIKAKRGLLSVLSNLYWSPPIQRLDRSLGIKQKLESIPRKSRS